MLRAFRLCLGGLGLCALSTAALAESWPNFLGPTRDGVVRETGLVDGLARGPRELWRRPLGRGYSGIAVAGGGAYTMAMDGERELVVALSTASGVDLWRTALGGAPDNAGYPGPRATPSVVGDVVVALSSGGVLAALDRTTGAIRWKVDLVAQLGGSVPTWGYSGSPYVEDGRVLVAAGGSAGLVALSLADGSVMWKRPGFDAAYATPRPAELDGVQQVLFFAAEGVVGLRPTDGSLVWQHPWTTNYDVNAATPVVVGSDRVFVASGYGVGGAALLVNGSSAIELWRTKAMRNKLATSVVSDGHLYGFNEDQLTCVRVLDGTTTWSQSGYSAGTVTVVEGKLLVLDGQGRLTVVAGDPAAHRVVVPSRPLLSSGPVWTAPSIADGVLYARDTAEVVALELRGYGPALPR